MLVLSRKQEQRIRIGENVTITILQVKGRSVRIGIDAPKEVCIVRDELRTDETGDADPPAEAPQSPSQSQPLAGQPVLRRRDRVRQERRSPTFGWRPMTAEAGDGPLRRRLDEQRHDDRRSVLSPPQRPSGPRHLDSVGGDIGGDFDRDLGGEAIIDRPDIDLHLDPYQQAVSLRQPGRGFDRVAGFSDGRFDDIDQSPVVRALRWRA
jgi:carbon storage regulator CsrA